MLNKRIRSFIVLMTLGFVGCTTNANKVAQVDLVSE